MSKKKKKNKNLKLSALVLLLLLTVVMLATSSYAWFTANKTVTVQGIDVHVETQGGLQISTNAVKWQTSISNSDITSPENWTANTNQMPANLTATSTIGAIDTVGALGHIEMFDGTVGSTAGQFSLTTTAAAVEAKGTTGNFIVFDIFLKADAAGPIYLTTDAKVTPKKVGETFTADNGLKNAARVAFVKEGNDVATADVATLRGLSGAANADVVIWEPNMGSHTANAVTVANTTYGITTTEGAAAAKIDYDGVKAAITTPILLAETNATDSPDYFGAVSTIGTVATPTTHTQIFSLEAGITKMRVYLWIEGQDVDCENNASGSDITYNISLSVNSTPAGG